jgi:peptidyl-prolyl cis-trans isomerase D
MLNSFRRFTKSRFGLIAVFVFLAVIALAFAAGDLTGISNNAGSGGGGVLAKVGDRKITDREVRDRIDLFLRNLQREGQNVTMEQFLAQGGLELAIDEMMNAAAMVEFAQKSGMQVSKKLIDGEIASNPSFFGVDGKFNQKQFEDLLSQNRISPVAFREGMTNDRYGSWMLNRATLGNQIPDSVVLPYASLLLERRVGTVGLVSTIAMDPGADPDEKTLTAWYNSKRARYMVPERRIVRYAMVSPDSLRAGAAATDAEIADAYKKAGNRFAATQKRTIELVTALDQNTAGQVAAKAKAGALTAAATASGLEARTLSALEKPAVATQVSQAFADAAFAAAPNTLVGPVKVGPSWLVYRVTAVEQVAAKTLDQARTELADEISSRKLAQAIADLRQSVEDGVGDGKTFDEAIADAKLTALRSPALTAAGTNPEDANFKPEPAMLAVMRAGFAVEQAGDEPQVVPVAPDGSFALVGLERIVAAAPRPLAQIRAAVVKDYLVDQALIKARAAATAIIAKLEKGVPMQQALTEAGVTKGPPPKAFDFKRAEVMGPNTAPYLQMAFSMAPKKAKLVEGRNREGFYVVYVDHVEEHSAAGDPAAMAQKRAELAPQIGTEYARQFIASIRNHVKVTRNDAAIAQLRAELSRTGSAR